MRQHGNKDEPLGTETCITLVEIKMCPDTDRTQQHANAEKQHEQLEALLVARLSGKGTVERKTILVGHSGTLYYDLSLETLMSLGVPRACALKALGKAHRLACQHLHSIVGVRRHLEPPRPTGQHRRGARPP